MPNPSQVSTQNINTELGVSSTAQLKLSNNWVKNVASTFSTANTNVKMGQCRWGINFPGGGMINVRGDARDYTKEYQYSNYLTISSYDQLASYDAFDFVEAHVRLSLFSNGIMRIIANNLDPVFGNFSQDFTWLTSGSNSDYTARFDLESGALSAGSSASNTDLALSSTREWYCITAAMQGTHNQNDLDVATGNLIIKAYSSGTTLITRPVQMHAEATLGPI